MCLESEQRVAASLRLLELYQERSLSIPPQKSNDIIIPLSFASIRAEEKTVYVSITLPFFPSRAQFTVSIRRDTERSSFLLSYDRPACIDLSFSSIVWYQRANDWDTTIRIFEMNLNSIWGLSLSSNVATLGRNLKILDGRRTARRNKRRTIGEPSNTAARNVGTGRRRPS